jgi:hypothetical protein
VSINVIIPPVVELIPILPRKAVEGGVNPVLIVFESDSLDQVCVVESLADLDVAPERIHLSIFLGRV